MSDKQGIGMFEANVNVIGTIPKNANTETHVTYKDCAAGRGRPLERFLDLREHWFRDGPTESPIPTSKGIMTKEANVIKLLEHVVRGYGGPMSNDEADHLCALIRAKIK